MVGGKLWSTRVELAWTLNEPWHDPSPRALTYRLPRVQAPPVADLADAAAMIALRRADNSDRSQRAASRLTRPQTALRHNRHPTLPRSSPRRRANALSSKPAGNTGQQSFSEVLGAPTPERRAATR